MGFRITGRHDSLLIAGFAFALLVIFQPSLQYLLNIAADVQRSYGVALIPALLILSVMFVFHLHANRREARAEAEAAASEASIARHRARELEQLMVFGQALNRALSMDTIAEAVWRHLPDLAGTSDVWVLIRRDGDWERMTDRGCNRWRAGAIEAIADAVAAASPELLERPDGIEYEGFVCYVIQTAGRPGAVVGVLRSADAAAARRTVGTASTLLGIAVRNVQLFAEVRDNGLKDPLTGCFNRAHGMEALGAELTRGRRADTPVSLLMFDIDHFKKINDEHGHPAGDEVLESVGARIRQVLRRSDLRCRYGGDEFMIVLPETSATGAARVAEWLRGEIEQMEVPDGDVPLRVSVSIGAATAQPEDDVDALIDRSHRALYSAKAAGRNCVRTADRPLKAVPFIAPARNRPCPADALELGAAASVCTGSASE